MAGAGLSQSVWVDGAGVLLCAALGLQDADHVPSPCV